MNSAPQTAPPRRAKEESLIHPPSVTLPKGGGPLHGIGEKFTANPATGTGSLSVPIYASAGRAGFGPELSLGYNSGSGNSPFGFGWSLTTSSIARRTSKGLPQYEDSIESNKYLFFGEEDLVPVLAPSPAGRQYRVRPILQHSSCIVTETRSGASGE
jgi:hypothetical protein